MDNLQKNTLTNNEDQNHTDKRSREEINRENAQKSTGPTSDTGKSISSQNAVKHGCYRPLSCDDLVKIDEIYQALRRDHRPEGIVEQMQVRMMAEAWFRKLQAERWHFGLMEKHYQAHPMQHMDPTTPASTIEDYETWTTHKKEIQTLDRLQGMFLARYEKAFRRLEKLQKNRIREEARVTRSGEDRRTGAPVEKGKLYDPTFAFLTSLVNVRNEAMLRSLEPSRKVEIPPEEENKQ